MCRQATVRPVSLPRDQDAGAICQKTEQPERLRLDTNGSTILEEALRVEIELEGPEAPHGLSRPSIHGFPAGPSAYHWVG
jgi:hypothetical protein